MDPDLEELLAELDCRRGEETRIGKAFPAMLHKQMVQVVNLSPTGARIVVNGTNISTEPAPLIIEFGDGQSLALMCEPKWEEKLGETVSVIGVAFPQGQPELRTLRLQLEAQTS